MLLTSLSLQHFRNYKKASFTFTDRTTIVIGPNAIGKTNFIESIFLLATGKSFRAEKDKQLIQFGKQVCRIKATLLSSRETKERGSFIQEIASSQVPRNDENLEEVDLEVVFADQGTAFLKKKYLVNGVAKRRIDFSGNLTAVLFTPLDLELVSGQPGQRRRFLDEVLEQADGDYRTSLSIYTKALRQRNALLNQVQETGVRNDKVFAYWDELLIQHGSLITAKREALIAFINARTKDFFPCLLTYDKSIISEERLLQYKAAEVGAGVTLVGPHRDDVLIQTYNQESKDLVDVRYFASRGQQRLVTLELKLAQIGYLVEKTGKQPLLLLDDIFSELDSDNIAKILTLLKGYQIIITTTHKEFVANGLEKGEMIELEQLNGKL